MGSCGATPRIAALLIYSGGEVLRLDLATAALRRLERHPQTFCDEVWRSDERQLVTYLGDSAFSLWSYPRCSKEMRLRGHRARLRGVRYSPCERLLLSHDEANIARWWDAETGEALEVIELGASTRTLYPAGGRRFTALGFDDVVRFYDEGGLRGSLNLRAGVWSTVDGTYFSPTPLPICEAGWPLPADDPRRAAYHEAHSDWAAVRRQLFEA